MFQAGLHGIGSFQVGMETESERGSPNSVQISPGAFCQPDDLELRSFPGAERYLYMAFYQKVFYELERGKRRWKLAMEENGEVELDDYVLQKTREIHEVNLSRRLTPRTMNSWNQTEWMGDEKIIKMSSLKAPILIGMFEKIREAGGPRLEPVYVHQ